MSTTMLWVYLAVAGASILAWLLTLAWVVGWLGRHPPKEE